ncbi:MAG: ABC transporter permease [Deltaproteobacteria bacterium]|nr:MAG: ABC transporter permease [Deltaproteobacteria bacterium]
MTGARGKTIVLWSIVWFNLIALSLPTIIILGASFTSGDIVRFPPDGLSLKWYARLWLLDDFKDAFLRTLYVSVICTIVSIPAGTLAALALTRYRIRFRTAIQVYLLLPFTIPLVVSGLGMMIVFGEVRILGQLWPVGIGLCCINLPFMMWAVSATVNALDNNLENAAANCGAPPLQAFLTVTLPAVMPGVITGALLMFILAFNEFLVSKEFNYPNTPTVLHQEH